MPFSEGLARFFFGLDQSINQSNFNGIENNFRHCAFLLLLLLLLLRLDRGLV
jgi:hypothetical protein